MRSRAGWIVAGCVVTGALMACGLDVVGSADVADAEDAAARPAEPEPEPIDDLGGDDAGSAPTFDAALPDETPIDAGPPDAGPCSASITENFAQGLGAWTQYGGVVRGVSGNNAYAQLIAPGVKNRAAGLFWVPPAGVKATAFKASFSYYVATPYRDWYMGDGMTFTWLTSTGGNALGANAVTGAGLGLQPGVAGNAFALDGWQNSSIGDLSEPSFNLLAIDPARGNPGSYAWHLAKKGPYRKNDVYDAWRRIEIVVANGKATARFRFSSNGTATTLFDEITVASADVVALGFTAATGGADAMAFFVDTVSVELTDPTCD
ncbi:MAG: hypothetical protein KIS78_26020 [Labilithrix sp.]|nr:hypothetical protein [Labilithrix sp.]MCW5835883.1 hypothetical protein [Labilithrix sp.]